MAKDKRMRAEYKNYYLKQIVLIIVLSLGLFSFTVMSPFLNFLYLIALLFVLLGLAIHRTENVNYRYLKFKNIILGFIFLRVLSVIPASLYHEQNIIDTLIVERTVFLWLFYFLLHKLKINPRVVLKIIISVGVIWSIMTIIQQFTYPLYLFASREDNETGDVSYRAGVYRYLIKGLQYGVLAGFYYLVHFFHSRRIKDFLLYSLFFIGIFFHSARQFIASFFFSSALLLVYLKGNIKKIAIFSFVLIGIAFFMVFDSLFAGYVTQSQEDLNDENIRLLGLNFFGIEYFPHWLGNILGNGKPYSGSSYGKEYFDYIIDSLSLYREDVGIIGTYNQYGILYSLLVVFALVKILLIKVAQQHLFVKLFSIFSLILLALSEYSYDPSVIPFFCLLFYLIDHYALFFKRISNRYSCL